MVVGDGEQNFLVDCGVSARGALHNLSLLGIAAQSIRGVVVTHEHHDHIQGVGALARKLKIPVYATPGLWEELDRSVGKLTPEQRVEVSRSFCCAGIQVKLFPTSHDSRESYGLRLTAGRGDKRQVIGIATDSGAITKEMDDGLTGCDALIVEANHDQERLWQGSYPWYLKKRVAGEFGHLANRQLAEALLVWVQENTQKIVLAHLSEENNTPELALRTVLHTLRASPIAKQNPGLRLRVAPRYQPHDLIVLG
jgi:phosphoribosyl 1,2-cyclic phosphodiesterase